jgi:hypothetical protein
LSGEYGEIARRGLTRKRLAAPQQTLSEREPAGGSCPESCSALSPFFYMNPEVATVLLSICCLLATDPSSEEFVLLQRAILECFRSVAWDIVVANRAVELAHREVYALLTNLIVEVPGAVDIGFQNFTA